jgi:ornithine cyclodeaminase/alanine dehydrogenase
MTKLLSKNDVKKVLSIEDTIEILEEAFSELSNANTEMPVRTQITVSENNGLALFMPAYLKSMRALGIKVVTTYKENPSKYNLPNIIGTITLLDEKTGVPLAIMDGGYLTAMRTGGVAGLASKHLARKDAKVHTLFGSGGMAFTHALAVDSVRSLEKLIIFSLDPIEKREAFKDQLNEKISCEIFLADNAEDAVREADIVTLITTAKNPIISGNWLQPGTHVNGNGSHTPSMREIDTLTIQNAKVVCDLIEACKPEAGDFIIPVEQGEWKWEDAHGSLGDVITGKISGRENDDEITLFKGVGLAIQDISTALAVYKKANEMSVGSEFKFF